MNPPPAIRGCSVVGGFDHKGETRHGCREPRSASAPRRKEDARFIRGQGTATSTTSSCPGMLHGAVLRSPVAHARIVSIDTSAALQHPKRPRGDHGRRPRAAGQAWMPTMSADVRRSWRRTRSASRARRSRSSSPGRSLLGPRRAGADRRRVRAAAGGVVEHPRLALEPDAPVIRDDDPGRIDNHIFDWEAGDAGATGRRSRPRRRRGHRAGDAVPALASGADGDLRRGGGLRPREREADGVVHDAQPHAHRTLYSLV